MNDFRDIEPVRLPGSERYWSGWEWGQELDKRFPDQQAEDFGMACSDNSPPRGVTQGAAVRSLRCIKVGENDGESWVWFVAFDDVGYFAEGWCDYTGWDCRSSLEWYRAESPE